MQRGSKFFAKSRVQTASSMRLGDGSRAIILVGLGVIAIITDGVHTNAGVIGLAISLLVVSLLLELTTRG